MMSRLWIILFLLLVWFGFSNNFHVPNILLGLFFSILAHLLVMPEKLEFKLNLYQLLVLIFYIFWELIRSSIQVAWDIITPSHKSQPEFIEVPLSCKHTSQISLLANIISLAPGTLAVDVSEGESYLVIHLMFAQDRQHTIDFIKNKLEHKVLKVIQYD